MWVCAPALPGIHCLAVERMRTRLIRGGLFVEHFSIYGIFVRRINNREDAGQRYSRGKGGKLGGNVTCFKHERPVINMKNILSKVLEVICLQTWPGCGRKEKKSTLTG